MSTGDHDREISVYGGRLEERLSLVRTIVAMANSGGGSVRIRRVNGDAGSLKTESLEDCVALYAAPRIRGIETAPRSDGSLVIHMPASEAGPHVFVRDGEVDAGSGALFHAGQIWVRSGDKERAAASEDVQRLVREAASRFLERVSIGLRDPSFSLLLTEEAGIPVHLVEDEDAVPVSPNLARLYPYTTKTLAAALAKPVNWVAAAAKVLRLKERRESAYGVPSPGGAVIQWRYSDGALKEIRARMERDTDWNPYREGTEARRHEGTE